MRNRLSVGAFTALMKGGNKLNEPVELFEAPLGVVGVLVPWEQYMEMKLVSWFFGNELRVGQLFGLFVEICDRMTVERKGPDDDLIIPDHCQEVFDLLREEIAKYQASLWK